MTPDERKMLTDLAERVANTPAPQRDPEAEELIRTKIGSRPDALYIMTQTVLMQGLALQQAQQQLHAVRPSGSQQGGSFLGQNQGSYAQQQGYGSAPPQPPQYAPQPSYSSQQGGGAGGFLRGAAQTAAGVAAGALAFQGIESLFHGLAGGFGGGGYGSGLGAGETVINNYYDNPSESHGVLDDSGAHGDTGGLDTGLDERSAFTDNAGYDDNPDLDSALDAGYDNGGLDDGGFDDSGSDDF